MSDAMIQIITLLILANGAPIVLRKLCGSSLGWSVDSGKNWPWDGRPVLGKDKTWRGVTGSLMLTGIVSGLLWEQFWLGFTVAGWAMVGDLFSSFIKRRLHYEPGAMALGLDQIPESLFPLMAVRSEMGLGMGEVLILVAIFLILELLLSRWLFVLHIRERPY
mgnify:CR=1 FL=1